MAERGDMLTVREAAEVLGIGQTTLRRLIAEGEIPVVRLPGTGQMRFSRRWLDRYIDALSEAAEADQAERKREIAAQVEAMESFLGRSVGRRKAG